MTSIELNNKFYPIYYFLTVYPKRSVFIVVALVLSGLSEAVSVAAMIPLLGMALLNKNTNQELGILEATIAQAFDMAGLEMTIAGGLLLVVLLMSLKSLLSFFVMREIGYICTDVEVDFRKGIVDSILYAD